jgi:hypothetical protein
MIPRVFAKRGRLDRIAKDQLLVECPIGIQPPNQKFAFRRYGKLSARKIRVDDRQLADYASAPGERW